MLRRRRLAIGLIGLLCAATPLIGVYLLGLWHIRTEGHEIAEMVAQRAIRRAERIIGRSVVTLTELELLGVKGCSLRELDMMRRSVYANFAVKEVAVTGADGTTLCNHTGDVAAIRPASAPADSADGAIRLRTVLFPDTDSPGLMLSLRLASGRALDAVIPGEVIATDIVPMALRGGAYGALVLNDGSVIGAMPAGTRLTPAAFADQEPFTGRAASDQFPISFTFRVPTALIWEETRPLREWAGLGGALASAIIACGFALIARRGPSESNLIRAGIERGEFVPHYQPVVDIQRGRLVGCEVLIRWRRADGTVSMPGAFIAHAEATGLALPMTLGLMRKVRDELEAAYAARPELKLSINLFDDHFEDLQIVEDVETIFGRSRIRFDQLVFEVTERQPLADLERARLVIQRLQDLGARVALDDAGTGHGGLAYLQELGMDVVKIDKLFIDTIGTDRISAPVVDSLIKLAHDLGMEVIAEGVERIDQLQYLRMRDVEAAQGHLFAPALPGATFLELVRATAEAGTVAEDTDGAAMDPLAAFRIGGEEGLGRRASQGRTPS
ncbi:EAL domain-containing protein [Prosthecomicrobium pneumaticum]|nr:EAL domain-containing protein [Prosthecomicrobium pneumaticum]